MADLLSPTSILLVTATKVESKAVLQAFEEATGQKAQPKPLDDRIYFDLGKLNDARVFLVQSGMGAGGLDASLLTVQKGMMRSSPPPSSWWGLPLA
jgi:nucleoside phosphorylase